jgi:undecaprenyl pyrophosphate synthase
MSGEQDDIPIASYYPNKCIEFAKELLAVMVDQETAEQLRSIIETISESAEDDGSGLARRLQRQIQKRQKQQDEHEAMGVLRGMYYEGREELEKALAELELEGKAVVVMLSF